MLNFRNDYSVTAHPKALEAILALGSETNPGYSSDRYCERTVQLVREQCECPEAAVHFFVGGTPANLTAIAAFLRPWEAVVAVDTAHIHVHEAGSIEATGHKILAAPSPDGKLSVAELEKTLAANSDPSFAVVPAWSTSLRPPKSVRSTPNPSSPHSPTSAKRITFTFLWMEHVWPAGLPHRSLTSPSLNWPICAMRSISAAPKTDF